MKKIIILLALSLSGCMVAPIQPYGYVSEPTVYIAPPPLVLPFFGFRGGYRHR